MQGRSLLEKPNASDQGIAKLPGHNFVTVHTITVSTLCAGTCPGHRDIPISQKTNCSHTEFLLPGHGGFCGFEDTVLSARTGRACVPVVKTAGIYRTAGDYRRKVALDSKNPTFETGGQGILRGTIS